MKNVIKKIAATAMAFTLIGTGTAISNKKNIQGSHSMVAQAGSTMGFKWFDLVDVNGKKATVRYDRKKYMDEITSTAMKSMSGIEKGVVCAYVAPNFRAKYKRFYAIGESFMVNPKRIQYNTDSVWIMTTSGYYVPIRVRELTENYERFNEELKRNLG